MKYLIILCLILMSSGVLAYDMPLKIVNLDKEKLYLLNFLRPVEKESTYSQIELRRTTDTPSKVQLGFAIMAYEDICVRYQRTNNTCVEFEKQSVGTNKWITLDFDNAKKLEKDDQEIFRFSVSQNDINADVIDINAQVVNVTKTEEDYTVETVEEGFFRNQGLCFISTSSR